MFNINVKMKQSQILFEYNYHMLQYSQEQNYHSYPTYTQQRKLNLLNNIQTHIEKTNTKLRMLVNSFREKHQHQHSEYAGEDTQSAVQTRTERRDIKNRDLAWSRQRHFQRTRANGSSPRGRSQAGDHGLPWKPSRHRHHINFNGQLSRVGHRPDEASLQAMEKLRMHQLGSNTYEPAQTQRKASSFRITRMEEKKQPSHLSPSSTPSPLCSKKVGRKKESTEESQFQVESINTYLLTSHLHSIKFLDLHSNPEEIFAYFQSIYDILSLKQPDKPVIKRYKNYIYYGNKPDKNKKIKYVGMLCYYNRIWYYGQMMDGKKNGDGVEIDVDRSTVWKGKFVQGQKTGYFHIEAPEYKYYGMVAHGKYHGQGHLLNKTSEYKGNFCEGVKEGSGWQKFSNKSEYKGQYFNGKFDGHGQIKAHKYFYQGLFKAGKPDGHGFERTEQYEYLGQFVMGVKEGKGQIKTSDGITMESMFIGGLAVDRNLLANSPSKACRQLLDRNLSKDLDMLNQESDEGTIDPRAHRMMHIL